MENETKEFNVRAKWIEGPRGEVIVDGMQSIQTGMPPKYHTPEHLLVAAVAVCFMNAFVYFAKKMYIEFVDFEVGGKGVLEKVGRSFEVTRISLNARVTIDDEQSRQKFERALELGAKYCFVANSLKATVEHEHEIVLVQKGNH
ncbi:MAG: OsmC family protein [Candidatus Thorarchaeota archaeon]